MYNQQYGRPQRRVVQRRVVQRRVVQRRVVQRKVLEQVLLAEPEVAVELVGMLPVVRWEPVVEVVAVAGCVVAFVDSTVAS